MRPPEVHFRPYAPTCARRPHQEPERIPGLEPYAVRTRALVWLSIIVAGWALVGVALYELPGAIDAVEGRLAAGLAGRDVP